MTVEQVHRGRAFRKEHVNTEIEGGCPQVERDIPDPNTAAKHVTSATLHSIVCP